MTDYFALLGFPRSPWLDPTEVQARFLELSAQAHPDKVHDLGEDQKAAANATFAELNKATSVLKDHKERLHHLLALETGAAPATTQSIPNDLVEMFSKIGQTCRNVDQFLAEKNRATSPVLQAQLFAKSLDWSDEIAALQQRVAAIKTEAEQRLRQLAVNWSPANGFKQLAELAHTFAMIARWEAQLQERFAALAAF